MASFLSIGFFVFIPPFYQKPAASHTRRRRFVFFYHYRNVSTDSPTVSGIFQAVPPSSVRAAPCQLPRRGSFCTVLSGIGFIETPQGSSQYLPQRGRGTARRRWMRGSTALRIVATTGAKVNLPSLTVGNGLCAVPLRGNYNTCGQNGITHRLCHSERSETESRNPLKLQILPYVGTFLPRGGFLHSACAPVGMT